MPLGDSITAGFKSSDGTGYRKDLQTELEDTGISFRYVGSESIGEMSNPQNEGHIGFRIDQISGIATQALSRWNPSVVLLHAGTNDMNQDYEFDSAQRRLQDLIYQIYAAAPDTTILVSKLILSTDPAVNTRIQSFNESTVQDVRGLQALGKRIELVDMSEVTAADMADPLHPNDTGYQKMANARDEAIVTALQCIDIASRSNIGPRSGRGPIAPPPPVGKWIDQGIIAGGVGADPKTSSVHFADFNGDGKADYLVVHENGSVDAWINAGGDKPGSSRPGWIALGQVAGGVGVSGKNIQFADINGDGKADYLAVHDDGSVDAWLNAGGDTPGRHGWIPAGRIARGVGAPGKNIQFADINGDGLADYLVVDPDTGAVDAWMNVGGDSPGKPGWVAYGRIATGVRTSAKQSITRFADLNNDGYADYIVISKVNGAVSAYINGGGQPKKWIWEPIGQVAPGYGVPSRYRQVEEADINGDGRADYLQVDEYGAVHAWLNNGRDQSHVAGWLPLGQIASGVITDPKNTAVGFGDLDGDGRADYFSYSGKLNKGFRDYTVNAWVNRGDRSGHWIWIPQSQVGPLRDSACTGEQYGMKFADITGDGKADYETICGNIAVSVFSNSNGQGQPTFLGNTQFGPLGSRPSSLRIVDFNGDGRADFLLLMPDRSVLAFINEGFPKVNYIPNVASGVASADKVRFADINGDGKADYLVVNDDGSVDAWLNAGGDASGKPGWISMGRIAGGIKAPGKNVQFADIDGNGRADYLLIDPANGAVTAWINNGTDKPF